MVSHTNDSDEDIAERALAEVVGAPFAQEMRRDNRYPWQLVMKLLLALKGNLK